MTDMRLKVLLCLTALPAWLLAQGQSDRPVFHGGVELIQLTVSVLDDARQPVTGLTAADFTVLENGAARPIRAFTPVEVPGAEPSARKPATAAWTREIAPDVATNQIGEQPGRLVVILMDRSIPHEGPTVTARNIAISIVNSLGPNDLAALVSTSGGDPQNFTADRARLITSIKQRDWATDSDAFPWGLVGSLSDGRCLCGLCVLETVTRIAEAVRPTTSRAKSLFFIGQGVIVQAGLNAPSSDPGCDRLVRDARIKMLDAVGVSGLVIHSIDPKGLVSIGPQTRASTPGGAPAPEGVAAALRRQAQQNETNEHLAKQGTLHVLPDMTGGRTVINRNMPEEVVPAIFRESQSYYLVGFEAGPNGRADGRRSIEVKVRRKGVRVLAQRQYIAPNADGRGTATSSATSDATAPTTSLTGLLPDAIPPLALALAAFANPEGAKAFVSINVDVGAFMHDAASSIPLDVSAIAVDQTGRPVASAQQTTTVAWPGPGQDDPAVTLQTHMDLAPGDYEVRVAIADPANRSTASVFSQIVVPAFASERLSLSDVVWHTGPLVGSGPARNALPVAMTTRRAFERADSVHAYLQVYQGIARTDPIAPVTMRVRVVDTGNHAARDQSLTLDDVQFSGRRADCELAIPVDHLAAGDYLLSIEAAAGKQSTTRSVRFSVRP